MKNKKIYFITIMFLFVICVYSCGKSRKEKTIYIIDKLNLVENQQLNFEWQIEPLKYHTSGSDSIKLIEIEKKLSDEEVLKRLCLAFEEAFTEEEINDIYKFLQTNAFDIIFNSTKTNEVISKSFKDIENGIEELKISFNKKTEIPKTMFEPIPVDREDGFYSTIDYESSTRNEDVILEQYPSLTSADILDAKKEYNSINNSPGILIELTKEGAQKFYELTKENIDKPIAIVIEQQIISMPIVHDAIMGGQVNISGDFSEEEVDNMISKLLDK